MHLALRLYLFYRALISNVGQRVAKHVDCLGEGNGFGDYLAGRGACAALAFGSVGVTRELRFAILLQRFVSMSRSGNDGYPVTGLASVAHGATARRSGAAMERVRCLAALPGFLAESNIGDGAFSAKDRLRDTPKREFQRRHLACHRFDIEPGRASFEPPAPTLRMVLDIALALMERGPWTLPSWRVEQALAARASDVLDWKVVPVRPPDSGDLGLRLQSRVTDEQRKNLLVPAPLMDEVDKGQLLRRLCDLADENSPGEQTFVEKVAAALPTPLLSMLQPQREAWTLGLDPKVFFDQRVDFALETPQGLRLVIEIDGSQHISDGGQAHLDNSRDAALQTLGWTVWRVTTPELTNPEKLRQHLIGLIQSLGYIEPKGGRHRDVASLFWASTALVRAQALILEAALEGAIKCQGLVMVSIIDHGLDIGSLAVDDLNELLRRLGELYKTPVPYFQLSGSDACELLVDVDVLHPLRLPPRTDTAVAWSRPAAMAVASSARRIEVRSGSPRFLPAPADQGVLDEFVRDLFRKNGFRRNADGSSDQALITGRILLGLDVVGLLPTGAGKSLPYMLAGLLLPGMTLYVGPLISLLQDQAERLIECGISHVEYISSAQDQQAKTDALNRVSGQGTRFLLVSPERFLTEAFLLALSNRQLWGGDISQVVIDECHCVSEWGHEFRPAYLSLGRIARDRSTRLGMQAPLVALTGTASTVVLSDVLRELGISGTDACIRSSSMDRPELSMRCTHVVNPGRREAMVESSVREFIEAHPAETDGVLIFCPFRGGRSIGVYSVAAHLLRAVSGLDVRFYCGGQEPWEQFAVFQRRKSASQLTVSEIRSSVPRWGLSANGVRPWSDVKAEVQREFLSGTKNNFRVLVATKAFGMGIDKPSIRKIIHVVAPTSPEAFYQEIGRAGRDRQPSEAELLFCDIEPEVTNHILDPGLGHEEVMRAYQDAVANDPYGGGDFLRTFYFHGEAFKGTQESVRATLEVASLLHRAVKQQKNPVVPFKLGGQFPLDEVHLEYGIVRLIHLGVVSGYLKDYNKSIFRVDVTDGWLKVWDTPVMLADLLAGKFMEFVRRYNLVGGAEQVEVIRAATGSLSDLYQAACAQMMSFLYQQVERQRRIATRAMLEIARLGAKEPTQMRSRLMNYLQASVRFTEALERLEIAADPEDWIAILNDDAHPLSPQDLAELHGAAQRVLGSFPTHPGLLFLSAVSRPLQSEADPLRSIEELDACVLHAPAHGLELDRVICAFSWFREMHLLQKSALAPGVDRIMGRIHIELASDVSELAPFLHVAEVRDRYYAGLLRKATNAALL